MKQVLIITNQSGFLWKFEMENVRLLQSMGYRVHYASNSDEEGYHYDSRQLDELGVVYHNIEIARSPYMIGMNYRALQQLKKIVEEEHISVIHCHTPVGGVLGRLVSVLSEHKPKVIYTAHGFHFYKGAPLMNNILYKSVELFLAPFTDALVLINKEDFDSAKRFHLKKRGKVYQIPGVGIDLHNFTAVDIAEKKKYKEKLGINKDTFFILSVGEVNKNKNHMAVIHAIKKMKEDASISTNFIYGICGDGFCMDELEKYVEMIGLQDSVLFFGYQSDVRPYYAAADVTAFPSIREGLGMAGIESLAMGVPVIASDNRGTREYMINGENGYVCDAMDVDGFIDGIEKVMTLTDKERDELSQSCVASIQRFSKEYTNEIMTEVYKRIDRG